MIRGVHHVNISVKNLEMMTRFYRDVLGFPEVYKLSIQDSKSIDKVVDLEDVSFDVIMFNAGNVIVELIHYKNPTGVHDPKRPVNNPGFAHICLDVKDIQSEFDRLKKAGMTFNSDVLTVDEIGLAAVYGRDPEGNVVELQEVFDDENVLAIRPQLRALQ